MGDGSLVAVATVLSRSFQGVKKKRGGYLPEVTNHLNLGALTYVPHVQLIP